MQHSVEQVPRSSDFVVDLAVFSQDHPPFIYEISRGAIGKKFLGIFYLGREI